MRIEPWRTKSTSNPLRKSRVVDGKSRQAREEIKMSENLSAARLALENTIATAIQEFGVASDQAWQNYTEEDLNTAAITYLEALDRAQGTLDEARATALKVYRKAVALDHTSPEPHNRQD